MPAIANDDAVDDDDSNKFLVNGSILRLFCFVFSIAFWKFYYKNEKIFSKKLNPKWMEHLTTTTTIENYEWPYYIQQSVPTNNGCCLEEAFYTNTIYLFFFSSYTFIFHVQLNNTYVKIFYHKLKNLLS